MEENMTINNFQGLQFPSQVQKGHFLSVGKDSGWLSLILCSFLDQSKKSRKSGPVL